MADRAPGSRALVTGASSGIGAAFAERLARDGYNLVLVARRAERLEQLAARLGAAHHGEIETMAADLADHIGLQDVESRITHGSAIDVLVNNAGFGAYMPFIQLPPDRAEQLIRLQIVAVTRLTRAALPGMVRRSAGAIINVSSL